MNRRPRRELRAAARRAREAREDAATVKRWIAGTEIAVKKLRGEPCDCGRAGELAVMMFRPLIRGELVIAVAFEGLATCARCLESDPPPAGSMVLDLSTCRALQRVVRVNAPGGAA